MAEEGNQDSFTRGSKWLIAGILLSFSIGIFFFLTIAMQRSGDKMPPDAGPPGLGGDAS